MKKISLKELTDVLTEKELKEILGGSGSTGDPNCPNGCGSRASCHNASGYGHCIVVPFGGCRCVANA